jgi:response regulator NasT
MNKQDTSSKGRILVADDDGLVLATLSAGLRELGYEILEASSGEEAVKVCLDKSPDLAILDMRMPGMSGIEAASQITKTSQVPFLFLSAFDDTESVNQAVTEGALGYLVKPLNASQIAPSIEAALSRSSDMDSLKQKEENLNIALNSSRQTSIAIGLIMSETGMSTSEAETALRSYSRANRRKMIDVAAEIVSTKQVYTTLMHEIRIVHDKTISNSS